MDQGEAYLWKQRAQVGADRITYLERLLDRAYPWLHCPYTPHDNLAEWAQFDKLIREVQTVIQHLKDEPDPPVTLPCASCDGDGCPNCEAPSTGCTRKGRAASRTSGGRASRRTSA